MEANLKIDHAVVDGAGQIVDITVNGQNLTAGAEIQNNKAATINVANYTGPVEIKPATGKDAMKKVTVTLEDIPSGGSASAYAWKDGDDNILYFSFAESPADQVEYGAAYFLMLGASGHIGVVSLGASGATYAKVDANTFTSTFNGVTTTYTRDAADDLTLWEAPDIPINPGD